MIERHEESYQPISMLDESTDPPSKVPVKAGRGGALPVSAAIAGILQNAEVSDPISGTRQTRYFTGASAVSMKFRDYGSAVAKEARVVFNATDDSDADAKALNPATRLPVPIGSDAIRQFGVGNECVRVDVYSDVASETGDSKLILEALS